MFQYSARNSCPGPSFALLCLVLLSLFVLSACGGDSGSVAKSVPVVDDPAEAGSASPVVNEELATSSAKTGSNVVIDTSFGEIRVKLDSDSAPNTVANFLDYVDAGHYDQTIFHRVIPGFMIQGGGFSVDYQRLETRSPILNEAKDGRANERYTIAMARTPLAHSATDQFFINVADNDFLNYRGPTDSTWGYAVFGEVTAGFEVVNAIVSVTTGASGPFSTDAPVEPVIISGISRE